MAAQLATNPIRPLAGRLAAVFAALALASVSVVQAEPFALVVQSQVHGDDAATAFAPLAEYLSEASGHRLTLSVPDSALAHWQAMARSDAYHLVLDEGHFTDYRVRHFDYEVLAKVAGVSGFSVVTGPATVFVELDELFGEPVASPPPPSLAALRLAELFPDPIRAPVLVEVGSYEEGVRRVISGDVAAAVIPSAMVRKHPQLNVVLSMQQEPGMALSASPAVPADAREVIRRAFLAAADIDAGRRALARAGLEGFEPASDTLYEGYARLLRGTWGY
jgi:ABC-type phosphate/phosphonate transport system substrate-binding protein